MSAGLGFDWTSLVTTSSPKQLEAFLYGDTHGGSVAAETADRLHRSLGPSDGRSFNQQQTADNSHSTRRYSQEAAAHRLRCVADHQLRVARRFESCNS